LKAADTSVIVAAFASWHEKHTEARQALDAGLVLIEHCALESYSVLTRLPPPHRAPKEIVRDFLVERFPIGQIRLSPADYRKFITELPERNVSGGSTYDALIAATAAAHDASLLTCDTRATPIYERYGVKIISI
jgi:predicted nucleic acid-binding protein